MSSKAASGTATQRGETHRGGSRGRVDEVQDYVLGEGVGVAVNGQVIRTASKTELVLYVEAGRARDGQPSRRHVQASVAKMDRDLVELGGFVHENVQVNATVDLMPVSYTHLTLPTN